MVRFFAAGNPALPDDSLAIRLAGLIDTVEFEPLQDPLTLLEIDEPVVILDVATGITEPQWIHASDSERLARGRRMVSLHDFDLQFVLHMGASLGELPDIWILAVPLGLALEEALPKVKAALSVLPTSPQGSGRRTRSTGHTIG